MSPSPSFSTAALTLVPRTPTPAEAGAAPARPCLDASHIASLMDRAGDAVVLTDPAGVIEYVNPAFERLTGYTQAEVVGRTPAVLKSGRQGAAFYRHLWETLQAGGELRTELVNRRKDGALVHTEETFRPLFGADGRITHFLASSHDVSERVAARERLTHEATHDALTGLRNRAIFIDRLEQALARTRRSGDGLAVVIVDIDHFKTLNDSLGHHAGDVALKTIAERLLALVRSEDTVARLGGDEFGILLEGATDPEGATPVLRKLAAAASRPVVIDGERIAVSLSIGAAFPGVEREAAELLRAADAAMYRVKHAGGGGVEIAAVRQAAASAPATAPAPAPLYSGPAAPRELMQMLQQRVPVLRRLVHAGDTIYRSGQDFACVYFVRTGSVKLVSPASDGREQVVSMHFGGDWLGLDGIADGRYAYDAVALDTGEVCAVRHDALLRAAAEAPAVLGWLHETMSREILRLRDTQRAATLPTVARVADFLRRWAGNMAERGQRIDSIMLGLSRAEIGSHLGMTLESASRSMSVLEREGLIRFPPAGRREFTIPDAAALDAFIARAGDRAGAGEAKAAAAEGGAG